MKFEQLNLFEPNQPETGAEFDPATVAAHIGEHATKTAYTDRSSEAAEDQGWGQREIHPRREVGQRGVANSRAALEEAASSKPAKWRETDV